MQVWTAQGLTENGQAYQLLARSVQLQWNIHPMPPPARRAGGKPWFPSRPDLHFNLSHSRDLALCALDNRPVGADIQIIKANWHPGLPRRVCSPGELAWLARQEDRWGSFALLWTMKEARVKYSGEGLTGDIRAIPIPLPHPGESLLYRGGLWFRLYRGEDWRACVCGETPPPDRLTLCRLDRDTTP